jgi:hypothetical protein
MDLPEIEHRLREIVATIPAGDRVFLVEVLTADDATRPNVIGNLHATAMVPATVELLIDAEEDPALRAVVVGMLREAERG